jgi:hypothetical protein
MQALVACAGMALIWVLPFHLGLRLVTVNQFVFAWKEMVQIAGCAIAFICIFLYCGSPWKLVAISLASLSLLAVFMNGSAGGGVVVAEAVLLICGGMSIGVASTLLIQGKFNLDLKWRLFVPLVSSFVFTCGILLNDALGLTYIFAPEQESTPWWAMREGITRARFTLESPMAAGQFMWISSLFFAYVSIATQKTWMRWLAIFMICFLGLGILKTGSRGPYALFAVSHLLFWGILLIRGNRTSRTVAVLGSLGLIIAGAIYLKFSDVESTDGYKRIILSSGDSTEASNNIRYERLKEGVEVVGQQWPRGFGLYTLPVKYRFLNVNFESHPLGLLASLGIVGFVVLVIQYGLGFIGLIYAFLISRRHPLQFAFSWAVILPFLIYSFVFPVGQDRFASLLLWVVLGVSLGCMEIHRRYTSVAPRLLTRES